MIDPSTELDRHRSRYARLLAFLANVPIFGLGVPAAAIASVLLLPLSRNALKLPWARALVTAAFLGVSSLFLASFLNGTQVPLGSIGQLSIFMLMLAALPVLLTSLRLSTIFISWFAGSSIIYFVTIGSAEARGTFEGLWKYGIAFPATILLVYTVSLRGNARLWPVMALLGMGTCGIFLNFRSHGLICFVAAFVLLAKHPKKNGMFRLVALSVVAFGGILWVLPNMLKNGVFGEAVRVRTLAQSEEGPLLLGGRTEPPLSFAAISERPIFGWGSAQSLGSETIAHGAKIAESLGLQSPSTYLGYWVRPDGFVSLHSVLLSSWVEGGIIAAIFPTMLVAFFAVAVLMVRGRWSAVIILIAFQSSWDIVFSPWSTNKGVALAAACIACAYAIKETQTARAGENSPRRGQIFRRSAATPATRVPSR